MAQAPQRGNEKPAPYNAGDESAIADATKLSKVREARRVAGLKKIVSDSESRAYLWELLSSCGVYRTSFTGNSTTFFNEGSRNIGLKIHADLVKHVPDEFVTMMKENQDG